VGEDEDVDLLDRAVHSVLQQTFLDWELLVVGRGSIDGIHEDLRPWARQDRRIRAIELAGGSTSKECREVGVVSAHGEFFTHLEISDEYYPDYLKHVAESCDRADVLMFGYDVVHKDGTVVEHAARPSPAAHRNVFAMQPVSPLGIAHRRGVAERLGGLHELQLQHEDSKLWSRLAQIQARFTFMPLKSGRQYLSPIRID
jgi:hypothetical protein